MSDKFKDGLRGVRSNLSGKRVDLFYSTMEKGRKGHNHQEVMEDYYGTVIEQYHYLRVCMALVVVAWLHKVKTRIHLAYNDVKTTFKSIKRRLYDLFVT